MRIDRSPALTYWHLWTDENGVSRQTQCVMSEFKLASIREPASPQWQGKPTKGEVSVMVTILPVGWVGTWHENPKPQWIIPLSGRWSVESMDGQRIEMGPGEISFGADQNTKESGGKKGHFSTTVGDEPAVLMLIQFETTSLTLSPCCFR